MGRSSTHASWQQETEPDNVDVFCPADGRLVWERPPTEPDAVGRWQRGCGARNPSGRRSVRTPAPSASLAWLNWIFDNEIGSCSSSGRVGQISGDTKSETMVASEVINYYAKNGTKFLAPQMRSRTTSQAPPRPPSLPPPLQRWARSSRGIPVGMPMMDVPACL